MSRFPKFLLETFMNFAHSKVSLVPKHEILSDFLGRKCKEMSFFFNYHHYKF